MLYWPFFLFFWLFFKTYLRLKAEGREHLPTQGGYIIASSHHSNLDPMLIGVAAGRKISFMAKDSLFKNKLFAFFLRGVMAFPVRRASSDMSAIKEAIKRLQSSHGLVVFPQGTRRANAADREGVKGGVGLLASKAGVPVVPALITGSGKAMPPGAKGVRPYPVKVFFAPAIYPDPNVSNEEFAQKIMDSIQNLLEKTLP